MVETTTATSWWRVGENRQLTGLRGIAALDVMISHYNADSVPFLHWIEFHNAAVDLFFCLSAFTLCMVYGAGQRPVFDLRLYLVARFARVYPLYIVSLVLAAVPVAWASGGFRFYNPSALSMDLFRQVIMVNAWPIVGNGVHWDLPAWSVSIEVLCYLAVFPPLFALSRWAIDRSLNTRLTLIFLLAFAGFVAAIRGYDARIVTWSTPPASSGFAYWAMAMRAGSMFVAGWLVYLSHVQRDLLAQAAAVATDALAVMFVLIIASADLGLADRQMSVFVFPFLILGLVEGRSITARLLASRPVHFLGVISYSVYLLHYPVSDVMRYLIPAITTNAVFRIGVPAVAAVALSTLSYYLIETPARRMLRQWLAPRRPADMAAIAGS
jgi:peptidoglycan/LPS O-acetylase OafA/YrhL